MKENCIAQAAQVILDNPLLISKADLVEDVIDKLIQNSLYEKVEFLPNLNGFI